MIQLGLENEFRFKKKKKEKRNHRGQHKPQLVFLNFERKWKEEMFIHTERSKKAFCFLYVFSRLNNDLKK